MDQRGAHRRKERSERLPRPWSVCMCLVCVHSLLLLLLLLLNPHFRAPRSRDPIRTKSPTRLNPRQATIVVWRLPVTCPPRRHHHLTASTYKRSQGFIADGHALTTQGNEKAQQLRARGLPGPAHFDSTPLATPL